MSCHDDRFESDSTVFKKPEQPVKDRIPLEDALRHAISAGEVDRIKILIELLPEAKREHYREIFRQEMAKRSKP